MPDGCLYIAGQFQLTATVTDTNGVAVADRTEVRWTVASAGSGVVILAVTPTTTTSNGQAVANFLIVGSGTGFITATAGTASALNLVSISPSDAIGQPGQPPDPATIVVVPSELTTGRISFQAGVTDTNGAPVPDGTPISWAVNVVGGASAQLTAISEDYVTTDGIASATYSVVPPGSITVEVVTKSRAALNCRRLSSPSAPSTPGPTIAIRHDAPPDWSLLQIDDTVTVTATVTDENGATVPDGTAITWERYWLAMSGGFVSPAADYAGVLETVSQEIETSSGEASATFRVLAESSRIGVNVSALGLRRNVQFGSTSYPEAPGDLELSLRLPADSDGVVATDSTLAVDATLTYSGRGRTVYVSGGVLRIAGGHEWESGRSALSVQGQAAHTYFFRRLSGFDICHGVSLDGATDWTCTVELDGATIYIPTGTPSGTFTISGAITVNGREYTDTLEVTIVEPGSIDEVAEVRFDFAEQERGPNRGDPWPAHVPVGGSTKFRLTALNENGTASAGGAIGSILLTTTIGSLSTNLGGGCVGSAGACSIPVSAVTAANADKIDITLTHADRSKAGRGQVRATLITTDGEAFSPPLLTVILAGEAASLAISEPTTGLLNFATASDDRDALTLTVTAADADGNSVEVPWRAPRAGVIGLDGEVVSDGISVVWTEDGDDSDDAHDQFTRNAAGAVTAAISVTASAASPLAVGDYTLELRTAGITTSRAFTVVGGADSITIAPPETAPVIGEPLTLTADVRDAAGVAVSDGTPVTWEATTIGDLVALVVATPRSTTEGGVATATFYTVNAGAAVVTATADGLTAVRRVDVLSPNVSSGTSPGVSPDASASAAASAAGLSSAVPNAYAVWLGAGDTLASSILASLSGIATIRYWLNGRWLFYGVADGSLVPGSRDAPIPTGAVLWLIG